ncbi:hypothetical protein AB2L27_04555 [Kineococcus sp. LSe6-4]|uniref:Uncharacterized protein n=1 Tax=Kineococcus halophytocola TaxID=3234027 RepID=A0ABV4GXL6_9ACTN
MAWAEWIVRMHHPHLLSALPSLFAGYGRHPPWIQRHTAMIAKCRWAVEFAAHRPPAGDAATTLWQQRLAITRSFQP